MIEAGKYYRVNLDRVKQYDSIAPYINLVKKTINNGGGKVLVTELTGNKAMVRAWELDILGDVMVPVDALS